MLSYSEVCCIFNRFAKILVLHQRKQKDERSYGMKFFLLALKNNRPVFIRYNTFSQVINIQEWTKKIVEDSLYKI